MEKKLTEIYCHKNETVEKTQIKSAGNERNNVKDLILSFLICFVILKNLSIFTIQALKIEGNIFLL